MPASSTFALPYEIIRIHIPAGDWLLASISAVVLLCGAGILWVGGSVWSRQKKAGL